ncbi:DUF4142 domain-containing protein [Asticcacaulis sp. BYS171W]|uniref:DUF4142 domain-containing protein n=1 Tax=Asticcacaulis aquaticus TaxID=2984212 RepID=A0ABT5HSL5_9CAUL|nr:DUF4142 domain-containing protein [Asticcacaulis aquaticus]MDC7682943.1 DUF4142 domain-containing protein [Asticcacaulis aquaticus]
MSFKTLAYGLSLATLISAAPALAQQTSVPAQTPPPEQAPPVDVPAETPVLSAPDATDVATDAAGLSPKAFVEKAYQANEFEIALSQMALDKATDPKIRVLAQQSLDSHMKVREGMIAAVQSSEADMNFQQTWTDAQRRTLAELDVTKGPEFDSRYMEVSAHNRTEAVELFEAYAATGTDAAVKTFATQSLPTLTSSEQAISAVDAAK